ncbi:MAG: hypothetical protein ACT4OX_15405 [Actinomycetota bacterium]
MAVAVTLALGACRGDDGGEADGPPPTTVGSTTPLVTTANGEPAREGEFEELASGDDDGLEWTLSRAPASGGGVCWRLETNPELDLVREPTHCDSAVPPDTPLGFRIDFPYSSGITTDHDIVVGVVPAPIDSAEFGFADGTSAEPTYLDEEAGIVVWAGASRPVAGSVDIAAEGLRYGCGPGDVTSALQLYGQSDAQLIDARQFVWTCLEVF